MEAPKWLTTLQEGFSHSIRQPLLIGDDGFQCQYAAYDTGAIQAMRNRGETSGVERLSTYNKQYWFRLLSLLQNEYPLLAQLLGLRDFNRLATAALHRYPSAHPELHHLPAHLLRFLDEETPWSTPTNRLAAKVDLAYFSAFLAEKYQDLRSVPLNPNTAEQLLNRPIRFQGSWNLIHETYNAVETRRSLGTADADAPLITLTEKTASWVIFRGPHGVSEVQLGTLQALLLTRLLQGESLVEACEHLQNTLSEDDLHFMTNNIQSWFQRWGQLGWFASSADSL